MKNIQYEVSLAHCRLDIQRNRLQNNQQLCIIKIVGDLFYTGDLLPIKGKIIPDLLQQGDKWFVLDFSQVGHIDDAKFFTIIGAIDLIQNKGGDLYFVKLEQYFIQFAENLGLSIKTADSVEMAIKMSEIPQDEVF